MKDKDKSIAIAAGITGVAALFGAAPFLVAMGCGYTLRECFRDAKSYEDGGKDK